MLEVEISQVNDGLITFICPVCKSIDAVYLQTPLKCYNCKTSHANMEIFDLMEELDSRIAYYKSLPFGLEGYDS